MSCSCCDDELLQIPGPTFGGAKTRRYGDDLQQIIWHQDGGRIQVSGDVVSLLLSAEEWSDYAASTMVKTGERPIGPQPDYSFPGSGYQPSRTVRVGNTQFALIHGYMSGGFETIFVPGFVSRHVWDGSTWNASSFPHSSPATHDAPFDVSAVTAEDLYILWGNYDPLIGIGGAPVSTLLYLTRHTGPDLSLAWSIELGANPQPSRHGLSTLSASRGCLALAEDGVYVTFRQRLMHVDSTGVVSFNRPLPGVPYFIQPSGENLYIAWANFAIGGFEYQPDEEEPEAGAGLDVSHRYSLGLFDVGGELLDERLIPDELVPNEHWRFHQPGAEGTLWLSNVTVTPTS